MYPNNGIYWDLDGSLTGIAQPKGEGSWATVGGKHLEWEG